MTRNNKKYKWCTSCNNANGAWGFHWKDGHSEWVKKQGKKSSVRFSNPATDEIIYYSYLMTTSEYSTEEEEKVGYNIQDTAFISLGLFELLE